MSQVLPLQRAAVPIASLAKPDEDRAPFDVSAVTEALAAEIATTAIERDRAGGHAAHERGLLRASGLLSLTIPREHGGPGADWVTLFRSVRRIAQADSAIAHLYGFHHLQVASVLLYGSSANQSRFFGDTLRQRLFWGNALNPLDHRAVVVEADGGYVIDGPKSFCSGSVGSDRLTVSAWHEATQSLLIAVLPTLRDGITVQADWDAFGQKQTDSGTVQFDQVFVAHDEVLVQLGTVLPARATLRSQIAQLVLVNLYLGIAIGAFDEARQYTKDVTRPWSASGVTRAIDDPFVQHRYGELSLLIRPAQLLADDAAARLDAALLRGDALTADERGEVAIAVAEAKALSHRAAIEISTQMFELTGARSTSTRHGFDRFWRNARVHTLHDPIDYKLRDIGRFVLEGRVPEPTPYS
jgi:alkylation response protein AidB-like acyl-CoA dehydrogenase